MKPNVINTDLTGKVVVVTGAGGVLCGPISVCLARAGAKVALLNRTLAHAVPVEQQILEEGGTAKAWECDVLNRKRCQEVADEVKELFGPCDILLNGAGGTHPCAMTEHEYYEPGDIDADTQSFFDMTEEGFSHIFNLNFMGTLIPSQIFAAQMVGRKGCSILNFSSMTAILPLTRVPAYAAAKAAVTNFTQWMAVHFAKEGIRVNAIAPGFFVTRMNHDLFINPDGTLTRRGQKIIDGTPMGRFGDSEKELIGTVLFLLNNEAASFITGVCIPIDGGFSAYPGV